MQTCEQKGLECGLCFQKVQPLTMIQYCTMNDELTQDIHVMLYLQR